MGTKGLSDVKTIYRHACTLQ